LNIGFSLLLRCLVFLLLALAFSRPYLSTDQTIQLETDERVRHCLLIDKSASMRREGLWEDTLSKAEKWLTQWKQEAYASVYLFDESIHPIVSFDDWSALNPDIRTSEILNRIKTQSPSWKATSIDDALLESLNRMEEGAKEEEKETEQQAWELVVISDLTNWQSLRRIAGSRLAKACLCCFDGAEPKTPTMQDCKRFNQNGKFQKTDHPLPHEFASRMLKIPSRNNFKYNGRPTTAALQTAKTCQCM
jgi:hypothetical protein